MKKFTKILALSLALTALSTAAKAQQSFGGTPLSFSQEAALRSDELEKPARIIALNENVEDIIATADWKSRQGLSPYIIGRIIPTEIDFWKEAEPVPLSTGAFVYRLKLSSPDARAIMLTFADFKLPKGARLYVYNSDRTVVLGSYTYETNLRGGYFSISPVAGEEIVLEYEPSVTGEEPSLKIDGVAHIFRSSKQTKVDTRAMGINPGEDDGDPSCHINVNCPEGDDWQDQAAGIVQMYMPVGNYVGICSGNLMNNTNEDFTPYILSAAHCAADDNGKLQASAQDFKKWIFTFHYAKQGCSSSSTAINTEESKSVTGSELKAFLSINGSSDGMLLQILEQIPENYRVYYNGWDRTATLPNNLVGMHHPRGDAMKISLYEKGKSSINAAIKTWPGAGSSGRPGYKDAHFFFQYYAGDTEGGSSGSPIFNEEKLVVGTLTGGSAVSPCSSQATQYYGRLNAHWDWFKASGDRDRVDIYLDPKGNGTATKLQGTWKNGKRMLHPVAAMTAVPATPAEDIYSVKVEWNEPTGAELAKAAGIELSYMLLRNSRVIAQNLTETSYVDKIEGKDIRRGNVTYSVRAIYKDGADFVETSLCNTAIYYGEIPTILDPKEVNANSSNGTTLIWEPPFISQEISKVGYSDNFEYKAFPTSFLPQQSYQQKQQQYLVYREKWPISSQLEKHYVSQISFVPDKAGQTVYLYISHDHRIKKSTMGYRLQKVEVPANWKVGTWLSVPLNKPFKLDHRQLLYVGFGVDNQNSPNSISYVANSSDKNSNANAAYSFYDQSRYASEAWAKASVNDYLAMRILISTSDKQLEAPIQNPVYGGIQPAPLPLVVKYIIKHNGSEIGESTLPYYTDKNNLDGSGEYKIEVVYDREIGLTGIEGVDQHAGITVTPTIFVDNVTVRTNETILSARLFGLNGAQLLSWDSIADNEQLQLGHLPAGTYILQTQTAAGVSSQKIIKR